MTKLRNAINAVKLIIVVTAVNNREMIAKALTFTAFVLNSIR